MIPLPPGDPRLRGLGAALDGDAMAAVFEKALGNVTMRACSPYYVRYKPERYARVQYRLDFVNPDGERIQVPGHVALYPPARVEKLAARHRLVDRGESDLRSRAVYLRSLQGIAQLFPVDLGLPGLPQAAAEQTMTRLFSRDLRDVTGGDLRGCEVELVRYKAGKRAVLKYHLDGTRVRAVYGKLRKDGAESLIKTGTALRRAGVPTPEVLAWLPGIGMVIQAEAGGVRLADLRHTEAYTRWMPDVADALARLHSVRVEGLPHWSPREEAEDLQEAARTIATLVPRIGALATSLARDVAALLATLDGGITTTHGSFHDDQVLVGDLGVTLIDMDAAMLGNPLADVGHLLSYLSAEHAEDAYERFLDRYLSARTSAGGNYLLFETASLLRWATLPFREQRPDWPEAIEERVRRAANLLDSSSRRRPV